MRTKEGVWREVKCFRDWDQADMFRTATLRDNPALSVRVRSSWGQGYIVEVCDD